MTEATVRKPGNELGAKTTYQQFLDREAVPAVRAFYIENVREVDLHPWPRMDGRGVYLNLDGTEGVNDCYICEISPGKSLRPQKHLFEELVFVVSGHGATTVWRDGQRKQTFEWGAGSLFSPPLNTWYQHFNGQGDRPARLLAMTNAPTVLNLFHNIDFVFNCDYPFTDRYAGEEDFFSGNGRAPAEGFYDTNFIRDVTGFELVERRDRGAGGRMMMIEMANNVMSAHISQFPVGTYKKAHRHGAGAHVIILKGEGFSLIWPEGKEIKRYRWGAGSLLVPPERWFHQHFNIGGEPARYLALKPFSSRKFPGLRKQWGISESVKSGGDQIEYEDEDPRIRQMFEEELAKRGARSQMTMYSKPLTRSEDLL
ncbi:MAG TPA: ethanolamine ammonia lyase-activating protein [Candidatus Binatia bacterium]|nr:ethanolamine ammonia lyase-activating protein [Candidatus Binatia bacterium]